MLKTLGDIYNHINDKLLDGNLDSIDDIIEYLEECQQFICERDPLEAPVAKLALNSSSFTLPEDFIKLRNPIVFVTLLLSMARI